MRIITAELPWGLERVQIRLPQENLRGILDLNAAFRIPKNFTDELAEIQRSLRQPIGTKPLLEMMAGQGKVVILVPDHTRPLPTKLVLQAVVNELILGGLVPEQLALVIARGAHPITAPPEAKFFLPDELVGRIPVFHSGSQGYCLLGHTTFGTPVEIDRRVASADFVLALGNIEPHRMAAFSGGAKAIMPGVASRVSIQVNHSLVRKFSPDYGVIAGNLIRQDAEEAARLANLRFIVNLVLSPQKQMVAAFAGDYLQAHRAGCELAQQLYLQSVDQVADVVIASAGGVPKDHSIYQAMKSLVNALSFVRPGGDVVLVAQCAQGIGDPYLEQLFQAVPSLELLEQSVKQQFILGYHKAEGLVQACRHARIHLIWQGSTDLPGIRTYPVTKMQALVDQLVKPASKSLAPKSVWVLPYAGYTFQA